MKRKRKARAIIKVPNKEIIVERYIKNLNEEEEHLRDKKQIEQYEEMENNREHPRNLIGY